MGSGSQYSARGKHLVLSTGKSPYCHSLAVELDFRSEVLMLSVFVDSCWCSRRAPAGFVAAAKSFWKSLILQLGR